MKYGEVARQVNFAYELGANAELGQLVQRGISARTSGITDYLLKSKHRFLGGLVIAVWGGEPIYTPLSIEDPEGMLKGLDREFGVLTFDGTQAYFALDGQHRLRAIKDAIRQNPDLGKEDICALIVTHYDSPDGRLRTRRLFSNINRNAKQTAAAENIALDEDDGFAILTRRMLEDHGFLRTNGRVRVILSVTEDGGIKLASGSVPKTDKMALTTFTVLYDMLQYLGYDFPGVMRSRSVRPSDDILEESYRSLTYRVDDMLKYCGDIRVRLEAAASARELRAPKNAEEKGHPFMRPVVQKAVARVVFEIMKQERLGWGEIMERLAALEWKMEAAPWEAVFSVDGAKMLTGKENTELLCELLHVHIAPTSMQAIKRARKSFKDVRNKQYPVSEEDLGINLCDEVSSQTLKKVERLTEISEGPEIVMLSATEDEGTDGITTDDAASDGGNVAGNE